MPPVSFDTFPGLGLSFVCQSMFFSQEEQKGLGGDNLLPGGGVVYSIQAFPGPFSSPYLFLVGSCCFLHFYDHLFIWVQSCFLIDQHQVYYQGVSFFQMFYWDVSTCLLGCFIASARFPLAFAVSVF